VFLGGFGGFVILSLPVRDHGYEQTDDPSHVDCSFPLILLVLSFCCPMINDKSHNLSLSLLQLLYASFVPREAICMLLYEMWVYHLRWPPSFSIQ